MKIELRKEKGKKVRDFHTVPGVLYGKGMEATSVKANALEFNKMHHKMGTSKTFEVELEGVKHIVYIKDVQPLRHDHHSARHFDLMKVSLDDTMSSKVRVVFVNKELVEKKGLVLHTVADTIEIEYAVGKGISHLELNVEDLEENDTLHVSDIVAPEGITIISEASDVVVSVSKPKEEAVETDEAVEEILEVESIKQNDE